VAVYTHNIPVLGRLREEDHELEASMSFIQRLYLIKLKKINTADPNLVFAYLIMPKIRNFTMK
jgi:hypothetical protein